jgi:hypothetical protein
MDCFGFGPGGFFGGNSRGSLLEVVGLFEGAIVLDEQ